MADIDMSAWFDDGCTTMSDKDKADEKLFIASQGDFAHRYPIRKDLFDRMSDLSIEGAALWMHGIDPRAIRHELAGAGREHALIELPDKFSDTLGIIKSAVRAGHITQAPFPSITVNEINDDTQILKNSFLAWHSTQETATLAKSHASPAAKVEAVPDTSQYSEEIPGKMPNVTGGKLAVKAAWQIECESGKRATATCVIERLKTWVDSDDYPELLEKISHGVKWATKKGKANSYDIDACGKTLETWNKSRAEAESKDTR